MPMDRREFLKNMGIALASSLLPYSQKRENEIPQEQKATQNIRLLNRSIKKLSQLGFRVSTITEYDTVLLVDKLSPTPRSGYFNLTGENLDLLVFPYQVRAINNLSYTDITRHLKN